ncbi:hypothetical protein, partial [Bilophila wadsworthia]|uniref:hypothetical protein n=1 Tax=Bilophila wadsworthia TaxID=35833 RepID=UPI003AB2EDAB
GEKIGDHCLAPLYTRFDRRNLYVAIFTIMPPIIKSMTIGKTASKRQKNAEYLVWGAYLFSFS